MNKVVYNNCYGGFQLSATAIAHILRQNKPNVEIFFYKKIHPIDYKHFDRYEKCEMDNGELVSLKDFGDTFDYGKLNDVKAYDNFVYSDQVCTLRHDQRLVKAVEELGEKASGIFSKLKITEIDSDCYIIDNCDGLETVITPDNIDWIKIE